MMHTLLFKGALGLGLLVSIAAAPFSGRDVAPSITTSGTFSAAMLDHSKSRWAREGQITLVDAAAEVSPAAGAELAAIPATQEPVPTAGGTTTCPVEHTECPVQLTTCPEISTHCPVHETVCVTTQCPETDTVCPVEQTVCEATECPVNPTYCPTLGTACPKIPTQCPTGNTTCPVVATQCPRDWTTCPEIETSCPNDPTVCEHTVCPVEDTVCPVIICEVCIITLNVGPPAGFVSPRVASPGLDPTARLHEFGSAVPTVTFLPATGG